MVRTYTTAEIATLFRKTVGQGTTYQIGTSGSGGSPGQSIQVNGINAEVRTKVSAGTAALLIKSGDKWLAYGQQENQTVQRVRARHRRGRRENPCTCTPNFVGLGAPRNFTFGVGGDYPLPRVGYRFLDTRTPRFYTYYDDAWNPESYAINPNPLDIELGDLIFVQESGNGSTCQHLQRWDGTVAVNYDYASACNA